MKCDKNYELQQIYRFSMIEHKTPTYNTWKFFRIVNHISRLQPGLFAFYAQKESINIKGANL